MAVEDHFLHWKATLSLNHRTVIWPYLSACHIAVANGVCPCKIGGITGIGVSDLSNFQLIIQEKSVASNQALCNTGLHPNTTLLIVKCST